MKKKSSYRIIKEKYEKQISELHNDIHTLIFEKDNIKSVLVEQQWRMLFDVDRMLTFGNYTKEATLSEEGQGILNRHA